MIYFARMIEYIKMSGKGKGDRMFKTPLSFTTSLWFSPNAKKIARENILGLYFLYFNMEIQRVECFNGTYMTIGLKGLFSFLSSVS